MSMGNCSGTYSHASCTLYCEWQT